MTREEIETCWKDPRNWKWYVYFCKADPRVIVPKRLKWMGWTLNFARPSAIPATLLILVILVGPIRFAEANGAGPTAMILTATATIMAVCLLCAYLSSRTG